LIRWRLIVCAIRCRGPFNNKALPNYQGLLQLHRERRAYWNLRFFAFGKEHRGNTCTGPGRASEHGSLTAARNASQNGADSASSADENSGTFVSCS
jgi:hypothetical protein